MEKKTKHRILGALVVAALVIILLPLLQNEKEFSSAKTIVKAPPFPDQVAAMPMEVAAETETSKNLNQVNNNEEPLTSSNDQNNNNQSEDLFAVTHPDIVKAEKPQIQNSLNNNSSIALQHKKPNDLIKTNSSSKIELTESSIKHKKLSNKALLKLKNSAWVIQIGSFKDKENALRLVNKLRSNGYSAFIQNVSTMLGESTRVYVGPENKQGSARAIANKLEAEMQVHGIVINYKPLTL